MTSDEMIRLPWSWRGPSRVEDDEGVYWELRIDELPDFCLFGETQDEVVRELTSALRAFLESYVEHGDTVPLPRLLDQWEFRSHVAEVLMASSPEAPEGQPRTGPVHPQRLVTA